MTTNNPKNTDQELLELAAKVAGIKLADPVNSHIPSGGVWIVEEQSNRDRVWDPLNNDGDALRLAIDLNIEFRNMGHVMAASSAAGQFTQYADGDPYSATRRAIVRAAAEMGRDKP